MPVITNTYTRGDLLGWAELSNDLFWTNEGTYDVSVPNGNGTLRVEAEAAYEIDAMDANINHGTSAAGAVVYSGELDISNIPSDAIIQQMVFRMIGATTGSGTSDIEGSAVQSGGTTVGVNANTNARITSDALLSHLAEVLNNGFGIFTGNNNDSDSDSGTGPGDAVSASAFSNGSDSNSIDFTAPTFVDLSKTKAEFISELWNQIYVSLSGVGGNVNGSLTFSNPGAATGRIASAEAVCATSIEVTEWEVDITFFTEDTDTPLVEITMEDPSGYVLGGTATPEDVVTIVDISGIYVLELNKRDDTWYDRSDPEEEATFDVKIPDPFVSLAFLPED